MRIEEIKTQVIGLLEENFHIKKGVLKSETRLDDIISDSMDFVELVAVLSTTYKIFVDPQKIRAIRTVGDVAQFLSDSAPNSRDRLSGF